MPALLGANTDVSRCGSSAHMRVEGSWFCARLRRMHDVFGGRHGAPGYSHNGVVAKTPREAFLL